MYIHMYIYSNVVGDILKLLLQILDKFGNLTPTLIHRVFTIQKSVIPWRKVISDADD